MPLEVISDGGSGRPFVVIQERAAATESARELVGRLRQKTRTIHVACGTLSDDTWQSEAGAFEAWVQGLGVAQVSVVGFQAATVLAQSLALKRQKSVRALVLTDPTCRPHPSAAQRFIEKIERILPLGLPFRKKSRGFDGAAFLHRIRCPTLLVTTPATDASTVSQVRLMAERLPTSWLIELGEAAGHSHQISGRDIDQEFAEMVVAFADFPARCPQRAR